jgi:hypothetical protein
MKYVKEGHLSHRSYHIGNCNIKDHNHKQDECGNDISNSHTHVEGNDLSRYDHSHRDD